MDEKDSKQAKRLILSGMKKKESEKFEKLKIELTEENERKFREIYQFIKRDYSFEEFINDWIAAELLMAGF